MKKIGLATFFTPINHGARLQAFALQNAIDSTGARCELLNYVPVTQRKARNKSFKLNAKGLYNAAVEAVCGRSLALGEERFRQFDANYRLTPELGDDFAQNDALDSFDAFVCGSDQIWARVYEDFFFLDFVKPPRKRVAYAPSFGTSSVAEEDKSAYRARLEKFDFLSVREIEGAAIIRDLISKDVPVVLDPTLLLSAADWKKWQKEPARPFPEKYILLYAVQNTTPCLEVAKQVQKLLNLPIIGVDLSKRLAFNPATKNRYDLGPQEWLTAFDRASYVVTSSFHGTAFAVNYGKPFLTVCQGNAARNSNSRMTSLSKLIGLDDRLVFPGAKIESATLESDLSSALARLENEREKSLTYLRTALDSVEARDPS
ncbi:MAG: polysaccharide pyruvyl transferase family protein [Thermoguttaceae bacterium]|nr:polysaccharide pyruvyl transferase family protein [Thermoguttaceae bacterium]